MKIALNKDFGGFGLSNEAHERLIELGVPFFESWEKIPKKYKGVRICGTGEPETSCFGKYFSNFDEEENRTNPLLIQVIEELGSEKASGIFAELEIVDIPDDIEYEIDDYDGVETIHEQHRSW
jgi:hypothetical protein